jgi:hypothetical protein
MAFGTLIAAGVLSLLKLRPDNTDVDWAKAPVAEETELRGVTTAS